MSNEPSTRYHHVLRSGPGHDGREMSLLTADEITIDGYQSSDFAFLLAHPHATVANIRNCNMELATHIPLNYTGTLKALNFTNTRVEEYAFMELFEGLSKLEAVSYHRPVDDENVHIDLIGRTLAIYGHGLKHFVFMNEGLIPFETSFDDSLVHLQELETLETHLELLIGFRTNPLGYDDYDGSAVGFEHKDDEPLDYDEIHESFGDWNFVDVLPHSLQSLTIHIEEPKLEVYYNTYERYGAKFEELITNANFDKLTHVQAPGLDAVAAKLGAGFNGWTLHGTDTMKRVMPSTEISMIDAA